MAIRSKDATAQVLQLYVSLTSGLRLQDSRETALDPILTGAKTSEEGGVLWAATVEGDLQKRLQLTRHMISTSGED